MTSVAVEPAHPRSSRLFNLAKLDDDANFLLSAKKALVKYRQKTVQNFSKPSFYVNELYRKIPIVDWLPKYKLAYLLPDAVAGVTVSVISIPQSLGYGLLATLNPVNGLYISIFPLIIYCLLGTSKHLLVGKLRTNEELLYLFINPKINTSVTCSLFKIFE